MTIDYIKSIAKRYQQLGYDPYRWFRADKPPAWQPLAKPLSQSTLGVLSTSGGYVLGQTAYHYRDDTSVRKIPVATVDERMRFSHITENYLLNAKKDPSCLVPLRALETLVHSGKLGQVAESVLTCMGGIYSQRRVRDELTPSVEAHFRQQKVDAVLLVAM